MCVHVCVAPTGFVCMGMELTLLSGHGITTGRASSAFTVQNETAEITTTIENRFSPGALMTLSTLKTHKHMLTHTKCNAMLANTNDLLAKSFGAHLIIEQVVTHNISTLCVCVSSRHQKAHTHTRCSSLFPPHKKQHLALHSQAVLTTLYRLV